MELQVEVQHTEIEPTLQDWIHARCEALNAPYEDIVHARVALVKHPRHLQGSDEARIFLTLSGKTLNVTRAGDTLEDALHDRHVAAKHIGQPVSFDHGSNADPLRCQRPL